MTSPRSSMTYLLFTAFAGGMSIMSIEIAISRLLAPYFGTSLLVWTNVLGAIMIALAVGYYFGGRMADKCDRAQRLYQILLTTGAYVSLIPLMFMPLAKWALHAIDQYAVGTTAFAFLCMVALLITPFVALGMVVPYTMKLAVQKADGVGHVTGQVLGFSNAGSILGTFLPALVTIPWLGTQRTIVLFGWLLMLVAIFGLGKRILLLIPAVATCLIFWVGNIKTTPGLMYDMESVYNYIQVVEQNGIRMLRLNEGHAEHSLYQKDRYVFGSVWDYYIFPPMLNATQEALFIGLAAGTAARQYAHFLPHVQIDGVEIDPAVVEVGKQYFDLKEDNVNIILKDGRIHLATTKKRYDTILIDAYKQPYIPFHLTTKEFFLLVQQHLRPGGVVGINVGSTQNDAEVLVMIQQTMKRVFKHVYVVPVKYSLNYLVWASDDDLNIDAVVPVDDALAPMVHYIQHHYQEVPYAPQSTILTDDLAPLELYTEKMILNFALGWKRKYL
ncbi:MAG: fused MFS/spermidine synthase [Bacteroidota bacterium]